jgi:DNA-binding NarL/FixJ family response regulator
MAHLSVILFEPSYLIREGIKTLLGNCGITFSMEEYEQIGTNFNRLLDKIKPQVVIINTKLFNGFLIERKRDPDHNPIIFVALIQHETTDNVLGQFDFVIDTTFEKQRLIKTFEDVFRACYNQLPENESTSLSERENTILKYIALGWTNPEIASKLYISAHTVMTHRKNITRKLGIRTISGLTVYAILNKLIRMEELEQGNKI